MIWNTRGSHRIFKFKNNSYINTFEGLVDLHVFKIKRMFLLVGRPLRSDKTKAFVKYIASSSFIFHSTKEIRKLLPSSKPISLSTAAHAFSTKTFWHFQQKVFVVCTRLVIKTPILSNRLCQRFLLSDQKLCLASHHKMYAYFLSPTLFSLQKFSFFQRSHAFLEILKIVSM